MATNTSTILLTSSRGSTIISEFIGKSFSIYNGKQYFVLGIVGTMLGRTLGEFVHTKKICIYKKTKKVNKKYIKK